MGYGPRVNSYLLIAAGLVALVVGAEGVVRGGSRLAARLGIPPIVIGLTIVSIGTSAPELAVGIEAAVQGNGSLAVGNIAGTNIVNLLLILGLSAAIRPLFLEMQTLRVDLPIMAAAAIVLMLMALDGHLSRAEGAVLVVGAVVYTVVVVRLAKRESPEIQGEFEHGYPVPVRVHPRRAVVGDLVLLLAGIVVVVVGADWLVDGSVDLARTLGVSDALIGLTIVAIGTSAPELATTVVSTIRGERDIAIGNLIGSSVYNIALILGMTALVAPVAVDEGLVRVDIPLMTAVALMCVPVFISGRRVSRPEGIFFVVGYFAYLTYLILART